jgi:hypothetical protein
MRIEVVVGPDWVSIGLAAGAFIVALFGLYLANVRRASIRMIAIRERPWIGDSARRHEGLPLRAELQIPVAVVNSGARPGVVTALDAERPTGRLFAIESCNPKPNWRDGEYGALPVASGASERFIVQVATAFSDEASAAQDRGIFTSFEVVIRYSYLSGRRIRPRVDRTLTVSIPLDTVPRN